LAEIGADFTAAASNRRLAKRMARNTKQHRLSRRINYFLKLTQRSSILAITAGRHDRGHFNETDGQQVNGQKVSAHNEIACSA
jgi:hypothetical protein